MKGIADKRTLLTIVGVIMVMFAALAVSDFGARMRDISDAPLWHILPWVLLAALMGYLMSRMRRTKSDS
jgi:hypothetical protein